MGDFKSDLHVEERLIHGKPESKFNLEMDVYRKLVEESISGFLKFMEAVNESITSLEDNMIMSNVQFKARIKDAIGTVCNTDKKPLDDIFGFELITANERSKEILMLIIHKLYDENYCLRINNHNKSNGYVAHHRIGTLKVNIDGEEFENIDSYILNAKTKRLKPEFRDLSRITVFQMTNEEREQLFEDVPLFPTLREEVIRDGRLDKDILDAIKESANIIVSSLGEEERLKVPVVEVQFKTASVAEEAVFGTASHVAYKPVDAHEIIDNYNHCKLMRGMHFPFKFQREDGKMRLQQSNLTLIEMYPFLRETIIAFRKDHPKPMPTYDMHFGTIFPELKPYIRDLSKKEPFHKVNNANKESMWRCLKLKALNPDFTMPDFINAKKQKEGEIQK